MAEFQEVMKQAKRMCEAQNDCEECPIFAECEGSGYISWECTADAEAVERKIMDWAAKHPEPRYPNWNEVWRQLFPNASNSPCPLYCVPAHMVKEYCSAPRKCAICRSQPIPADIAENLWIKPIGGNDK